MLTVFFESFKALFKLPPYHTSLESFIISHNPQTVDDIDRLEREYQRMQSSNLANYSYFHE